MSDFATVCQLLESLSLDPPTHQHSSVANNAAWAESLAEDPSSLPSKYQLTKTLVFKPKSPKSVQEVTLIVVVALDASKIDMTGLAKSNGFKEMRMANEDLLKQSFSGVNKEDVSPFILKSIADTVSVRIFLDEALLAATTPLAFHPSDSSRTIFLNAAEFTQILNSMNVEYKTVSSSVQDTQSKPASKKEAPSASKQQPAQKQDKKVKDATPKSAQEALAEDRQMTIGIEAKKEEDFARWYQQVLTRTDMLDYYDISGCYIIRPWAYRIWQDIQNFFNKHIEELGVENCYFPMFVSGKALEKEKDHVEGFAPEVAWVTKA